MKEFFIIIGIVVLFIVIIGVLIKHYEKSRENKIINKTIDILNKYGKTYYNNKSYFFEHKKRTYELYFQYIQPGKEVSINNETTWQIYGNPNTLINQDRLAKNNKYKIVIIYPNEERIKRYINESEVQFVEFQLTYTYYAINFNNLEDFVESL